MISLIAAISEDGFISKDGRIPWKLPRDVRHFREYCAGKHVLVGRRTYDEMKGWFTNHRVFILTRNADAAIREGSIVNAVEEAKLQTLGELVVLGGGEAFSLALPIADRLVLTRVHTEIGHGVAFPAIDFSEWEERDLQEFPADAENPLAMTISTFHRLPASR